MTFRPLTAITAVFSPYRLVLDSPQRRAFVAAAWAGRFPKSALGLGLILLIALTEGDYALAGTVSAAFVVALAIGGPRWSRAMDIFGVRRVLPITAALLSVFAVLLLVAISTDAPVWTWFVLAVLTGLSVVDMGSVVRSRWASILEQDERLPAFALESINDELVFVVSPPIVTLLATLVDPVLGFVVGLVVGLGGYLAFAWGSSASRSERPTQRGAAVPAGILGVVVAFGAMGVVFGGFDISAVALAEQAGVPVAAGLLIGVFALASVISGTILGARPVVRSRARRFVVAAIAYSILVPLLALSSDIVFAAAACAAAGVVTSPLMITGIALVEHRAEASRLTETLAYPTAAIAVGGMLGAWLSGHVIESAGAQAGFLVPAVAAATVVVTVTVSEALVARAAAFRPPE
ncbi:MFS family permease [Leifsonia sp. AK011]|uniref:MFS transporter n=1 Tax=Leifsonia sp. AK011 TaxID=2723075 RepID=UPI0015CC8671|nr:MFS transporter [Leifsonia sp. AK011]NYF10723.1 MFS family permease [Leifsonia sp. AK011]